MANRADNFNRTGSVALGGATPSDGLGAWTDHTSSFATGTDGGSGQVVCFESSGTSTNVASLDCGSADAETTVEYVRIDNQGAAAARVADANNFYFFMANSAGATSLWKRVGGTFTKLADGSISFTPGVGNTLGIRAVGSALTGYVNGVSAATATDSDLPTGNRHGLRTATSFQFANSITITDLGGGGSVKSAAYYYSMLSGGGVP